MAREVLWREAALKDLRDWSFTKAEWKVIRAEVERVAKLNYLSLDSAVCKVTQTGGDWWRLKITEPAQIRVFFTQDAYPPRIIIQAIRRRAQRTYDVAEILCKVRA